MKAGVVALAFFRIAYGLFFVVAAIRMLVPMMSGEQLGPPTETGARGQALLDAFGASGFLHPLLAFGFLIGGAALLLHRTAPLGIVVLGPAVTIILLFHVMLTGFYVWGFFWAAGLALLAWRYRSAFGPLIRFEG